MQFKMLLFGILFGSASIALAETEVVYKMSVEVPNVTAVEKIINTAIKSCANEETLNSRNELDLLVLFDFDGVLFPFGGSGLNNFDHKFGELIQHIKDLDVTVGGLTNRFSIDAQADLKTFDAAFNGFNLLANQPTQIFSSNSGLYKGAMYAARSNPLTVKNAKGVALQHLFDLLNKNNQKITTNTVVIFIDDSPTNLNDVAVACKKANIKQLINIHYVASWSVWSRIGAIGKKLPFILWLSRKILFKWAPFSWQTAIA